MKIQGDNINIRPVSKADLVYFHRWWNDSELMAAVLAEDFSIDMDELEERYWPLWESPPSAGPFMHVISIDEKPIGEITHSVFEKEPETAEMHIKICETGLWGKGYGSEAVEIYVRGLFESAVITKVILKPGSHNKRMINLCRRLGFKETGREEMAICNNLKDDLFELNFEVRKEDFQV